MDNDVQCAVLLDEVEGGVPDEAIREVFALFPAAEGWCSAEIVVSDAFAYSGFTGWSMACDFASQSLNSSVAQLAASSIRSSACLLVSSAYASSSSWPLMRRIFIACLPMVVSACPIAWCC